MADTREENYFFLCLFLRKRFLRLCVAILCLFLFLPLGIMMMLFKDYFSLTALTKTLAGLNAGML